MDSAAKRARDKAYREANKVRIAARYKDWYDANREQQRAYHKAWFSANKSNIDTTYKRLWDQANPDKVLAQRHRRRASLAAVPNDLSRQAVRDLLESSNGVCAYCLRPTEQLHLEHCTPLSRGGWNMIDNVVMACVSCNLSKGSKTVLEYACKMV